VADEPTGSLDSVTADHIFDVFEHLVSDQGKTIIMVTHDQSLAPRFTRTFGIADGELSLQAIDPEPSAATITPPAGAGAPGLWSPPRPETWQGEGSSKR
jgi:ABC-type lipoprotein export system ATPase subunit